MKEAGLDLHALDLRGSDLGDPSSRRADPFERQSSSGRINRATVILGLAAASFLGLATEAPCQLFLPMNGKPVTATDFAGKTICWSNGHVAKYGADGSFANSAGAETRWRVPETGVLEVGNKRHCQAEVQQDGQVHLHWLKLRSRRNPVRDLWGQYCSKSLDTGTEDE
jgi:hypothetical protein